MFPLPDRFPLVSYDFPFVAPVPDGTNERAVTVEPPGSRPGVLHN